MKQLRKVLTVCLTSLALWTRNSTLRPLWTASTIICAAKLKRSYLPLWVHKARRSAPCGKDTATVKRLYAKVKHLTKAIFNTDDWDAFAKVLPKNRHQIGKKHTVDIERNNSNTRHRLTRMTRHTKVVSHSETMIDLSMRLFAFFEKKENRAIWVKQFLSIY